MAHSYPSPEDIGIRIPRNLKRESFCKGFLHALKGGQITESSQLRRSHRYGFRAGKLYLKELRRRQGIINFPAQGKIRTRTIT